MKKAKLKAKSRVRQSNDGITYTPAEVRKRNKAEWRAGLIVFGTLGFLCGLQWLYERFEYVRYYEPGVLHFQQHQYSAAESDFRSYLHVEYDDEDGHYFLGRTLLAEGKVYAARAEFLRDGVLIPRGWHSLTPSQWIPNSRSAEYLHHLSK